MEAKTITIVSCERGDWSGLYVDGILECEGHQITEKDFVDLIRTYKVFEEVTCFEVPNEQMDELGSTFPFKLEDIKHKGDRG